jgi:hypothetical protein
MRDFKEEKETARLLGIRLRQEDKSCDSLLDDVTMKQLCTNKTCLQVNILVNKFIEGWSTQDILENDNLQIKGEN